MNRLFAVLLLVISSVACADLLGDPAGYPAPTAVTFEDTDPGVTYGGEIIISRASDESAFLFYSLQWGLAGACESLELGAEFLLVPKIVSSDLNGDIVAILIEGSEPPLGTENILVFTKGLTDTTSTGCAQVPLDGPAI